MDTLKDVFLAPQTKPSLETLRAALGITLSQRADQPVRGMPPRAAALRGKQWASWEDGEDPDSDASYAQERSEDEDFVCESGEEEEEDDDDDSGSSSDDGEQKKLRSRKHRKERKQPTLHACSGWFAPDKIQKALEYLDEDEDDTESVVEDKPEDLEENEESEEEEDDDAEDEQEDVPYSSSDDYLDDDE